MAGTNVSGAVPHFPHVAHLKRFFKKHSRRFWDMFLRFWCDFYYFGIKISSTRRNLGRRLLELCCMNDNLWKRCIAHLRGLRNRSAVLGGVVQLLLWWVLVLLPSWWLALGLVYDFFYLSFWIVWLIVYRLVTCNSRETLWHLSFWKILRSCIVGKILAKFEIVNRKLHELDW